VRPRGLELAESDRSDAAAPMGIALHRPRRRISEPNLHNAQKQVAPLRPRRMDEAIRNPPGRARSRGPLYAALDLGTNDCRLLIARPHESTASACSTASPASSASAEGLSATGQALRRGDGAPRWRRSSLCRDQLRRARAEAASAPDRDRGLPRTQQIGEEFIARVDARTGARSSRSSRPGGPRRRWPSPACADLDRGGTSAGALMFDIGGGSSELALARSSAAASAASGTGPHGLPSIRSWQSLPVGVVSIAEQLRRRGRDAATLLRGDGGLRRRATSGSSAAAKSSGR